MVLINPNEEEINVQNALARQVRDLAKRVQHLETLDRIGDTDENDFVALDKTELTANTPLVTFTNISGIYAALKIIMYVRTDRGTQNDAIGITFNNDTSGSYDSLRSIISDPATLATFENLAANEIIIGEIRGGSGLGNIWSPVELIIPSYANAVRHKMLRGTCANRRSSSAGDLRISDFFGNWRKTDAIVEIDMTPVNGTNFVADSNFYLYGLRASA